MESKSIGENERLGSVFRALRNYGVEWMIFTIPFSCSFRCSRSGKNASMTSALVLMWLVVELVSILQPSVKQKGSMSWSANLGLMIACRAIVRAMECQI